MLAIVICSPNKNRLYIGGISQISQSKVERFLRSLPPKFGVISPRTCRFLGLAVKPISLHPRQSPGLFLLQIWWSSKRIIETFKLQILNWRSFFALETALVTEPFWTRYEAVYLAFFENIWMQRELVGIDDANFNQELVRGFVFFLI